MRSFFRFLDSDLSRNLFLSLFSVSILSGFIFSCEELGSHFRVASHQSTLPYNSYVKDPEPIKAHYKITLDNCTDDEATYIAAKGITQVGLISRLIEDCWKEYQEKEKKGLVERSGVAALRNMDQSIIREVPFCVLYGFKSDREACKYNPERKRAREE